MAAGTFGLAAFEGIFFYLFSSFLTASLVALRLMIGEKDAEGNSKYFKNAVQVAYSHAFANSMTYMLFWIMFYNVVHVVWISRKIGLKYFWILIIRDKEKLRNVLIEILIFF